MKLSTFARRTGICYRTAWRWWKTGKIKGYRWRQGPSLSLKRSPSNEDKKKSLLCTRVSLHENRPNLDASRTLVRLLTAKGLEGRQGGQRSRFRRQRWTEKTACLLADPTVTVIVVEHKDRLTRFGFKYIETLLAMQGRSIEVVNVTENPIEDIIADFVSILYSFCAKLYGQRRAKRKRRRLCRI